MRSIFVIISLFIITGFSYPQGNPGKFISLNLRMDYTKISKEGSKDYIFYNNLYKSDVGFFVTTKNAIGLEFGYEHIRGHSYSRSHVFRVGIIDRYYFIMNENFDFFMQGHIAYRAGRIRLYYENDNDWPSVSGSGVGLNAGFVFPVYKRLGIELQLAGFEIIDDSGVRRQAKVSRFNISFLSNVTIGLCFRK